MEIPDFFKYLSSTQKSVVLSFGILFPIYFSLLFVFVDNFKNLPLHVQLFITSTASIIALSVSFAVMAKAVSKTGLKLISSMTLSVPSIHFAVFLIIKEYYYSIFNIGLAMFVILNIIPYIIVWFFTLGEHKKPK